jgi:TRAP-type C4-dicarboxylate transport system permease large subunit
MALSRNPPRAHSFPQILVNGYVSGMNRDVPLETIFRGSMPFLAAMIVVALLLILLPDIALILPRWIHP